jgi:hypothetical protein
MSACAFACKTLQLLVIVVAALQVSLGQQASTLLRLQRSKLAAEIDASGGMRGSGGNIMSLGASPGQMGTATYPSSASCLVVYNDGKYVFEKRDEQRIGSPKTKSTEGTLDADVLQQLKSILNSDDIKNLTALKSLQPPEGAQLMREAETMEVQITREDALQHFLAVKERFKTAAIGNSSVAAAASTGMDTYLDNASAYRKSLNPLVKWFEGIEKKSKSSLKESKPQYCGAMTM